MSIEPIKIVNIGLAPKVEKCLVKDIAVDSSLPSMLRVKAINTLGLSGDISAFQTLQKCARDKNTVVKSWAEHWLKNPGQADKDTNALSNLQMNVPNLIRRDEIRKFELLAGICRLPKQTIPQKLQLLDARLKGMSEEVSGFLTASDVKTLADSGVNVVPKDSLLAEISTVHKTKEKNELSDEDEVRSLQKLAATYRRRDRGETLPFLETLALTFAPIAIQKVIAEVDDERLAKAKRRFALLSADDQDTLIKNGFPFEKTK